MRSKSTIMLDKETINMLKRAKEYPRQTYDELLRKISRLFIEIRKRNQYDEFLPKVQQPKMKELWDNEDDEAWENV